MLIIFVVVPRAKTEQEREEFFKSLKYSHCGEIDYQVFSPEDNILSYDIKITIPDDCLVLRNAWNKYIKYALDNGLPQHGIGQHFVPNWRDYVQSKMGLQTRRPPEGIFPDLKVELPDTTA